MADLKAWKDLAIGGVILDGGNSDDYETGSWRTYRPVHYPDRCIHCLRCWIFCPDSAIIVKNEKVVGVDFKHCKGCGICAKECPTKPEKAIEMKLESE
ncbi:unnamed protein product, partial [marine sediment metagenome]